MNALRAVTLILSGLLLLAFVVPISGQSGIIVNGAHTVRTVDTISSPTLNNLLGGVQARIVTQYANNLRDLPLRSVPTPLQTLLGGVAQRIVTQYANSVRHADLVALPALFQDLLASVSARIVFEYANGNRQFALGYPRALLNDTVPPVINNFANTNAGGAKITWNTDEFAHCIVHYGTQSGNYTGTLTEALYAKQHEATLADAVAGITYYVQLECTDQSDNTARSSEFNFTVVTKRFQFLPFVRR
ncbi:MAG: hypothetical protein U0350_02885 [Caldilineaceae bacterium]